MNMVKNNKYRNRHRLPMKVDKFTARNFRKNYGKKAKPQVIEIDG